MFLFPPVIGSLFIYLRFFWAEHFELDNGLIALADGTTARREHHHHTGIRGSMRMSAALLRYRYAETFVITVLLSAVAHSIGAAGAGVAVLLVEPIVEMTHIGIYARMVGLRPLEDSVVEHK